MMLVNMSPRKKQQFDEMRSATKEKIMAAGLQLFAYKGLADTSIQDIAKQAGISSGLMYHYYKSKDDLFTELVEMIAQSAADSTQILFDSDLSPAEKIQTFSKDVIESIVEGDELSQYYLLMIHYILVVDLLQKAEEIRETSTRPLEFVKRTIVEGQALGEVKPGDPDEMVVMYLAAIQGLAIAKLTMGDRFVLPSPDLLNGLLLKSAESGN
jgi:AcrR family transcriptional regulator